MKNCGVFGSVQRCSGVIRVTAVIGAETTRVSLIVYESHSIQVRVAPRHTFAKPLMLKRIEIHRRHSSSFNQINQMEAP